MTTSALGVGNAIIGYNELRGSDNDFRGGSHMLVIGDENNYRAWGGIVAGEENWTSAVPQHGDRIGA